MDRYDPYTDKFIRDTIDRQAAIDALDVLCQEHRYKIPGKAETYSQYNEAWQDALDRAEGAIFNLPPAKPKRGKWIKVGRWGRVYKCNQCGNFLDFDGVNAGRGNTNFCPNCGSYNGGEPMSDLISRQAAIDAVCDAFCYAYCDNCEKEMDENLCGDCHRKYQNWSASRKTVEKVINALPSAQPERVWTPCDIPPEHHRDVIVRGIEAIGNVTVHKVMQWDVDTWRPTDYAPSVMWKEWSEI